MTKKLKITVAICVAVVLVAALTIGLGVGLTVNRGGHTHTWAAEWSSDKDGHWHDCTDENCDEINDYAAHSDGNSDGKCDVCGYTLTTETPGTDPEEPGTDPEEPGTDPEEPGTDPEEPGTDPEEPGTDPEEPGTDPEPEVVAVTGVTLDVTEKSLKEGETLTLTVTVAPKNATNKGVKWSSDDETVATVSEAGVVTALKAGEAVITATTEDGNKTATCTITVTAAATEPEEPDPEPGTDPEPDPEPEPGGEATSQEFPFDYAELNQKAPDNTDSKHKTTSEITVGKFTLEAGIYHDGSTNINSQGKSIKVVLGGDQNSISFSAVSASNDKEVAVTILNAEGVAVLERTVLSKAQQAISADNLPAGTYTIQTENSARIYNLKATEYYLPCACENLTLVAERKEPTCTEAGNIAYWRCDDCGKLYSDAEGKTEITEDDIAIPAKGHNPANGWSHDDASHWHACLNGCGTQIDKAAHDTNGADGACSVCGYIKGHTHVLTEQKYTDGCVNNPVTYYTCSGCSNLFIDKDGTKIVVTMADIQKMSAHDLVHHTAVEATCEHAGNIEYWECDSCHKFFTDEGITEVEQSDIVEVQLNHNYQYQSNSAQHWKECTMCKTELDGSRGNHSFGAADAQGNQTCTVCKYTVNTAALKNVKEYGAYEESMYVVMQNDVTADLKVTYKAAGSQSEIAVPSELIRTVDGATRVDIVGVSAGTYDINLSIGGTNFALEDIEVEAYDRSGYAHFDPDAPNDMYANGIGAYENDGTLKDGALVIYLTEENKNDISDSAYVYDEKTDSYTKEEITGIMQQGKYSIGYFLNNRQYASADRSKYGVWAASLKYGAVDVRVVGKVSAEISGTMNSSIEGLTAYNSADFGGSKGDNGRMARITDAFNLTIEGVGEDASIYGWGIHFIASGGVQTEYGVHSGESFEVRNIIFDHYPEDAVGMEGQGETITVPVQRCWVHNNVFMPGYASSPAESDKAEGDGSCDFKRGYYFTFSYNYLEGCHKTNLIGSDDGVQQYNISFHHNWWNNCGSRIPLAREANIHYYNNYVSVDDINEVKNNGGEISYVISARSNSYLYVENNYFDGCKQLLRGGSTEGGTVKFYGNTLYGCFDADITQATNRYDKVSGNCSYPLFGNLNAFDSDTTGKIFYQDYYLTDSVTARQEVMTSAGVHGFGSGRSTAMNEQTPNQSVSVGEDGLTVDLKNISGNYSGGVLFNKGNVKGKGQIATFTLTSEAEITISGTQGNEYAKGFVVAADGTIWIENISDYSGGAKAVLPAGTYFIASGEKDKEFTITSLSFADTSASSDARVQAAKDAIEAIPSQITLASADFVTAARNAYNALTASEKQGFDSALLDRLEAAESALGTAQVKNVENLISQIGDVTADSYEKISAARAAYNALSPELQGDVNNYSTLTAAEEEFKGHAVNNVNSMINDLKATEGVTDKDAATALLTEYENARSAYDALDEEQQKQVVGYGKVERGIAYLEGVLKVHEFKDMLAAVDVDSADMTALGAIVNAYNGLDETLAANLLTSEENEKYELVVAKSEELASQTTIISFGKEETSYTNQSGVIAVTGNTSSDSKYGTVTYNGVVYSTCLKIESSTSVQITAGSARTLLLYSNGTAGNTIKIDGEKVECDAEGVFKVQINGSCTITKGDSLEVFVIVLAAPEA